MIFKSFQEIRHHEISSGHDNVLASCFNFASDQLKDAGGAVYIGQNSESGRVVMFITEHGDMDLRGETGDMIMSQCDVNCEQTELAQYEWCVALNNLG